MFSVKENVCDSGFVWLLSKLTPPFFYHLFCQVMARFQSNMTWAFNMLILHSAYLLVMWPTKSLLTCKISSQKLWRTHQLLSSNESTYFLQKIVLSLSKFKHCCQTSLNLAMTFSESCALKCLFKKILSWVLNSFGSSTFLSEVSCLMDKWSLLPSTIQWSRRRDVSVNQYCHILYFIT